MEVIGIDHFEYFLTNRYQIKVENNGVTKFSFVENFPISHHIKSKNQGEVKLDPSAMIECRFIFKQITLNEDDIFGH